MYLVVEVALSIIDSILRPFQYDTRVLFVCTENICRSPLAEGLLRHHLQRIGVDGRCKVSSCGTIASNSGARPDQRAQRVASEAGVNIGRIKVQRVKESDLVQNDFVFAMDRSNLAKLEKICPSEHGQKLSLLLSHLPGETLEDVPDPYYGSYKGFEEVYQLIDRAVLGLISTGLFD